MPNKDVCAVRCTEGKEKIPKWKRRETLLVCACRWGTGETGKKRCFPCVAAAAAAAAANNNETECEAWNSVELALGNTVVVSSPRKTLANWQTREGGRETNTFLLSRFIYTANLWCGSRLFSGYGSLHGPLQIRADDSLLLPVRCVERIRGKRRRLLTCSASTSIIIAASPPTRFPSQRNRILDLVISCCCCLQSVRQFLVDASHCDTNRPFPSGFSSTHFWVDGDSLFSSPTQKKRSHHKEEKENKNTELTFKLADLECRSQSKSDSKEVRQRTGFTGIIFNVD